MDDEQTAAPPVDDPTTEPDQPRFTYRTVAPWRLEGVAGSIDLDRLVAFCITIGLGVEFIEPGAYRITGQLEGFHKVAEWVNHYKPAGPLTFNAEQPPPGQRLQFKVAARVAPPRSAVIHGQHEPERSVARAIDAGLTVVCIGIDRFHVAGPTRCHIAWMQALFEVKRPRALEILNLTEAQAVAEDSDAPPVAVNVVLPVRETASVIKRDSRGDITEVKQIERTV